jgi:hypothetical protein
MRPDPAHPREFARRSYVDAGLKSTRLPPGCKSRPTHPQTRSTNSQIFRRLGLGRPLVLLNRMGLRARLSDPLRPIACRDRLDRRVPPCHPSGRPGRGRADLHRTAHHRIGEHHRLQRRSRRPRLRRAPVIEPDRLSLSGCASSTLPLVALAARYRRLLLPDSDRSKQKRAPRPPGWCPSFVDPEARPRSPRVLHRLQLCGEPASTGAAPRAYEGTLRHWPRTGASS